MIAAILGLARFATDQGAAPFPRSPEALEDRARELVKTLGYTAPPGDTATWWGRQYDSLTYRAANIPTTRDRRELASAEPHPWWFYYRQSPRYLIPENVNGAVGSDDPPFEVSGMVTIALDARGNLMRFRAAPPQVEPASNGAPLPDWKPLFVAAGLDPARFTPSVPRWLPSEPFDAREDWDGAYASSPEVPIHVSAAAWRGKPVSFEIIAPWSRPTRMQANRPKGGILVRNAAITFIVLSALVAGVLLARRNLRLGRGDRRGAMRVALFLFSLSILYWMLSAHHVADVGVEFDGFLVALAQSVFSGLFSWMIYIAIEPLVRRRWPQLLISWSRLLAGRFRDPLVGRDALAGILFGAAITLTFVLSNALPSWIDLRGMTPVPPSSRFLLGVPDFLGLFLRIVMDAVERGLAVMTVLLLAQVLLRRKWLAMTFATVLLTALSLSGENYAVELPAGLVVAALTILVAVRFGILALIFSFLTRLLLVAAPLSLDFSRWHAARGLVIAAVIAGLAVWAFRVSLGGKAAFAGSRLDEG